MIYGYRNIIEKGVFTKIVNIQEVDYKAIIQNIKGINGVETKFTLIIPKDIKIKHKGIISFNNKKFVITNIMVVWVEDSTDEIVYELIAISQARTGGKVFR